MFFVLCWFPPQCIEGGMGTDHYYNLGQNIATWSWWQGKNSAQNLKVRTGWMACHNCLCNYTGLFWSFRWLNMGMSGSGSPHSEIPNMTNLTLEKPALLVPESLVPPEHLSLGIWGKFQHNWATPGSYNLCLELLRIPVSIKLLSMMYLTSIRFCWNSYIYQFKIPMELILGYSWYNQGGTSLNLSPKIQIYILDIIVT